LGDGNDLGMCRWIFQSFPLVTCPSYDSFV
jgi:hypothetical protein